MKKRTYDKAFKEHAVNLWLASGKSARQVADELGIKPDRLFSWKNNLEALTPQGQGVPMAKSPDPCQLQAQVLRLQRENQMLRQQRDILKKTLGILSEPLSNATSKSKL